MEEETKTRFMSPCEAYEVLTRPENFSTEWSAEIDEEAIKSALETFRVYPKEFKRIVQEETEAYKARICDKLSSITSGEIKSNEQIKEALEEVEIPGFLWLFDVSIQRLNPRLRRVLDLELENEDRYTFINVSVPRIVGWDPDLEEVNRLKDLVGDGRKIPISIGKEGFGYLRQKFESGKLDDEALYTLKLIFQDSDIAIDLHARIMKAQSHWVRGDYKNQNRNMLDLTYNSETLAFIEERGLLDKIEIPARKGTLEALVEKSCKDLVALVPSKKIAFSLIKKGDDKLLRVFLYAPRDLYYYGKPATGAITLKILDSGEIEGKSAKLSMDEEVEGNFKVVREGYSYSVEFGEETLVFNYDKAWEELSTREVDYRKQAVLNHYFSEEDLIQRVKEVAKEKREKLADMYYSAILEPIIPIIDFATSYQFEKES